MLDSNEELSAEFESVITNSRTEYNLIDTYFRNIKFDSIKTFVDDVKKWPDNKKALFILFLIKKIAAYNAKEYKDYSDQGYQSNLLNIEYIDQLLKSNLNLSDDLIFQLFYAFRENDKNEYVRITNWPVQAFIKQLEHHCKKNQLTDPVRTVLNDCRDLLEANNNPFESKQKVKLIARIDTLLFQDNNEPDVIKPVLFLGEDAFSAFANTSISNLKHEDKILWYQLLTISQKASGSKPSSKYLDDSKKIIDALGHDKFKKTTQEWFEFVVHLKESIIEHTQTYGNQTYNYSTIEFLSALNTEALKGFVWMTASFHDNKTIQTISKLAERCFKKIPQKGPASAALGNACLYTLFASKGLDGIAQLSRLRLKIKQTSTLSIIEKYIEQAAEKLGISSIEIEDIAVDDFKLKDASRTFEFEPFTCRLELTGIGKSELKWFKENGEQQKTVPSLVKEKFAAKFKKAKDIQKQIDQTTASQKERFDRMLRSNRQMSLFYFKEKYLAHGLLSFVVKNVLFCFSKGDKKIVVIQLNGQWVDFNGAKKNIEDFDSVSLWHPVTSTTAEVRSWRAFLIEHQIQQPFKQAFREIYLLTDAEINTRTYSNRMASHILKQHQYVTLAKGRSWGARLMGAWDGGDVDTAVLHLPEYGLRAEYWVNALNTDDAYNETGIWNYVTTDQIRFIDSSNEEAVELIHVPPVIFSEVLRDVDLFVGVASVGNDPTWSDSGGLPTYRDYWQSYSFGDLSEIAKNRKEILVNLIPRLKIAKVTSIEDKFVVVKGKLRTYKIHIGSTNILMEPNDQYLCIVQDRSKNTATEKIFLPFEGDSGLSVILSKAFLLADDDKITDTTITSQINR
jgi:hypothetical protein